MGKDLKKPDGFLSSFDRKPGADKETTHYCPGCGHGRIHKLIAEALETLEITDKATFISPVGCSVFGYYYFNCGNVQAAHGRAPAVATGVARSNPDGIVISYQGDGDLAAIGTAEIIHAANRGENMTVIFVNNSIYGMTGGQMAPTSLEGQKTTTSPYGRNIEELGSPMKMCELISQLSSPVYVERVAVSDTKNIMKAKRAIQKALKSQKEKQGFSFVEVLSGCPTGLKQCPVDSIAYINEDLVPVFPLGVFKDETKTRSAKHLVNPAPTISAIEELLGVHDNSKILEYDPTFVKSFKEQKLRIAGFGGQGVLMAGTTLAYLGMECGLEVTWLPSYGPEMRGGTANCHVCLSSTPIGTPVVESPNILIAMNGPSLDSFEGIVEKGGHIIVNSSVTDQKVKRTDVKTYYIPMTEIAERNGVRQAANMAAIVAYLEMTQVMEVDKLKTFLKSKFKKPDLLEKNFGIMDETIQYLRANYQ